MRYGMLVIQAILPAIDKGGQRVLATCDCGRQTETRLNRLKTAEPDTKSCGCLKIAHYKAFLRRSVDHLSGETVCAVWTDHFLGQSRFKIARAKGIAVSLVDECIRTYQTRVNTMVENRIAGKVYLAAGDKGGVEAAAAAYSLPLVVARYLTMVMSRKKPAAQVSEITYVDGVGMICEMYYNLVAERERNYELGIKHCGEFTFREIRRSKGQIVGSYAEAYIEASKLLSGRLELDLLKRIVPFVELVNQTLRARTHRQKSMARQIMRKRNEWNRLEKVRQQIESRYQEMAA